MYDNQTNIQLKIIKFLVGNHEYLSSNYLSNSLGISSKKVRRILLYLNEELRNYGASIDCKVGVGYLLEVYDSAKFDDYLEMKNFYETKPILSPDSCRAHFIVRYLLCNEDYTKIEDIVASACRWTAPAKRSPSPSLCGRKLTRTTNDPRRMRVRLAICCARR